MPVDGNSSGLYLSVDGDSGAYPAGCLFLFVRACVCCLDLEWIEQAKSRITPSPHGITLNNCYEQIDQKRKVG